MKFDVRYANHPEDSALYTTAELGRPKAEAAAALAVHHRRAPPPLPHQRAL